jgi:exodeoxyribonuclease VIII
MSKSKDPQYLEMLQISDEMYYADRHFISNSSLKLLRESPNKFNLWLKGLYKQEDTSAFALGKAVHSKFLENIDTAVVCDIRRDKRTEAYRNFLDENYGKNILSPSEYKDYQGMVARLASIDMLVDLVASGKPEVAGFGMLQGIDIKGKADLIVEDFLGTHLFDLKTTASTLQEFSRSAKYLLYNQQAAFYSHLFDASTFTFIVVEKKYPYEVGIFTTSEEFIQRGWYELETSINMYKQMFLENDFDPNEPRQFTL